MDEFLARLCKWVCFLVGVALLLEMWFGSNDEPVIGVVALVLLGPGIADMVEAVVPRKSSIQKQIAKENREQGVLFWQVKYLQSPTMEVAELERLIERQLRTSLNQPEPLVKRR